MKRDFLKWISAGLCVVLVLGMTGCGSAGDKAALSESYLAAGTGYSNRENAEVDYGYATEVAEEKYADAAGSSNALASTPQTQENKSMLADSDRKLIRTVGLNVETKEFDGLLSAVEGQVNALGGYIESMDTYNGSNYSSRDSGRYSNLTVRIPKQHLDTFLNAVAEAGNIVSRNENVEDVTLAYVDMESRKKSLETEQERLTALLETAGSLEDIITLEDRLSSVRYQLESMESQLRTYDNKVDYSTVNMYIREVKELTPVEEETTGERIVNGFLESLEDVKDGLVDFFIWFVVSIPYLAVWAVIIAIIVVVIKAIMKHNRKKKAARLAKMTEEQTPADK